MRTVVFAALITVAAWLTYKEVGNSQFVLLDDDLHLSNNPHLSSPASLWGIWEAPYQGLYIPMTYTVWAAEKAAFDRYWGTWGRKASGPASREAIARFFHWVNWGLHLATTLLALALLWEWLGNPWAALVGALFFCLHPLQVEPIAWVSGLKDVLSGFFAMAALVGFLKFSRKRQEGQKEAGRFYAWASLAYVLALLSKPSAIAVPLIAFLIETLGRRASWKTTALGLIPWFAMAIPLALITKLSQPSLNLSYLPPWFDRPIIAFDALTFYLSKILAPTALAPDYGRHPLQLLHSNWRWATWAVPILIPFLLLRRRRGTQSAFAVFAAALLPVLGFVPFFFQEFSTVADRYVYLAMLGPAALVGGLFVYTKRIVVQGAIALLLVGLAFVSHAQVRHWTDSIALFRHTIRINPDSILAHNNLGTLLEEKDQWLEAAYHYSEVIRLAPDNPAGHYNYGRLLARLGNFEMALEQFAAVVRGQPHLPEGQYSMGLVLLRLGRRAEAKPHFIAALQARPKHADTLAYLGTTFREEKNCETALRYYEQALELKPGSAEANLGKGQCLVDKGQASRAVPFFEKAAQLDPHWQAPKQALALLRGEKTP